MLALLTDPAAWASLVTLTVMEIVLGIDNIVFISVLTGRLPAQQAERARKIGLGLALIFRIILLMLLSFLIGLTAPLFAIGDHPVSWRDVILLGGGLFLIVKATLEIHKGIEGEEEHHSSKVKASFAMMIAQIIAIDLVFSVDSIITAIGMADHLEIMIVAVCIAIAIMYLASGLVSQFIHAHPTTKMLALSFLLLIGVALVADGIGYHIPKGFIYFAMAFSAGVEVVNIMAKSKRAKRVPVEGDH
ncbi:integral membrane protein, YkoY family [Hartmannibacter diazotrophicus]|uniref:Integral membrane protein, YkoY family n=1 Tax=Hartmannibacter diazotrophicus TaxID=1482074 RepID=A0A2C9D732_9HYPH|nr:TerC family protein [Hartmannibacter diazotrophicus]SON56000.1 integral membrane protein, YkoY family [Hartmannibacter diazotrophicus]